MFGAFSVWYLFLGGAGAGLLFVTALIECLSPHAFNAVRSLQNPRCVRLVPHQTYCHFFGPAYGIGVIAVVLGMLCLLLDLGRSERALLLFVQPTFSFIGFGAFALAFLLVFAALPFSVWALRSWEPPRQLVGIVRVLLMAGSLVVMVYTGLLLSSMPSVQLWFTVWLTPLFVVSALSTGIALLVCSVTLLGAGDEFEKTLRRIQKVDAIFIGLEGVFLALVCVAASHGSSYAQASLYQLLQGDLALLFWGLVVLLGMVVPFVFELINRFDSAHNMTLTSAAVLVGGFFLRWCIVMAASTPDMANAIARAFAIQ